LTPPSRMAAGTGATGATVDLYWLPLGAGGHFVRLNGRAYEAVAARIAQRPVRALYHSALQIQLAGSTFVVEQTPVPHLSGSARGVVAEGAVGSRWARRFRIFRYEVRLWRDGNIADVAEAVDSPHRLSDDATVARRVLDQVAQVPTPVWGRDELDTGEMWNSNSIIAWVIARSGIDTEGIRPPAGGRAPGWNAGLAVARRSQEPADDPRMPRLEARSRPGARARVHANHAHAWLYARTGGRLGGSIAGRPVLLLTSTGRRSGLMRRTPVQYERIDGDVHIIASNGGAAHPPAWWHNVRAQPYVQVQIGPAVTRARAVQLDREARRELWPRLCDLNPQLPALQAKAGRELPVMRIERDSD